MLIGRIAQLAIPDAQLRDFWKVADGQLDLLCTLLAESGTKTFVKFASAWDSQFLFWAGLSALLRPNKRAIG